MPYSLCCAMGEAPWMCRYCKTAYCGDCTMQKDRPGYWDPLCKKCQKAGWRIYVGLPLDEFMDPK